MKNQITYKKDGIILNGEFLNIESITELCAIEKIKEESIILLKMQWKGGRGFDGITEIIALTMPQVEIIKKHILGREIYFGEIAGKHSEVFNTLDENDIELITEQKEIIDFLKNNPTGHDYDHSFLLTFIDLASEGYYDDLEEKDIKEISDVICNRSSE